MKTKIQNVNSTTLALAIAGCIFALTAAPQAHAKSGKIIPGAYIVTLKNSNKIDANQAAVESLKAAQVDESQIKGKFSGLIKGFHGNFSAKQIERLKKHPHIERIEQDTELEAEPMPAISAMGIYDSVPAQPTEVIPWGVARVGYGDGTGKTAWVIDSGIRPDHPDLNVDMARSKSFITGITSVLDGYGHGTLVAGIIGAKINSIGVVGVAANATIVALRVFDDAGRGSMSYAIKAVNHVLAVGKPGDVINMSLGGGASTTLDDAVKAAGAKGILVAIAAGNDGIDCKNNSPARANGPGVYTVSSMNNRAVFSGFSNFGLSVDYAAPGEGILSTNNSGGYSGCNGTSCAAPHVAGLLLINGNSLRNRGFVTGDKDSKPDPAVSK